MAEASFFKLRVAEVVPETADAHSVVFDVPDELSQRFRYRPGQFLTLGLGIHGEAPLESFLRWSDQPLVKLAESGLVFLLLVHMLGGLRLLVIENLPWRDGQKELATIAAGLSAVIALILLARLF